MNRTCDAQRPRGESHCYLQEETGKEKKQYEWDPVSTEALDRGHTTGITKKEEVMATARVQPDEIVTRKMYPNVSLILSSDRPMFSTSQSNWNPGGKKVPSCQPSWTQAEQERWRSDLGVSYSEGWRVERHQEQRIARKD